MKKVLPLFLAGILTAVGYAQNPPAGFDPSNYGVRIEPDKRVLIVLATIDAAREQDASGSSVRVVNTKLSAAGAAFRSKLDAELNVPDDLRQKISTFLIQHRKRRPTLTDAEIVTPFVAMAYSLSGPPDFSDPVVTSDLPGELLDVLDFAPLVREFYRRSGISAKLDQYVKDYQITTERKLRGSTREMVAELLDYLHTRPQTTYVERVKVQASKTKRTTIENVELRERERRFTIVPEMLAPSGNVQFLNIRDDYYVVLPPDTDISVSEARRAFIQYIVDAIVYNHSKDVSSIIPGVKQLLNEQKKVNSSISPDAFLAVTRSLTAAIDARESEYMRVASATQLARQKIGTLKTDDEKRKFSADLERFKQAQADEAALKLSEEYENGAVLSFYFARQLRGLEESGFDIASSMREMLLSFDPAKESNRLAENAEARKRALAAREARKANPSTLGSAIAENPVTARLLEIEEVIKAKNYQKASADLNSLMKANPSDPRIYYNLGRVAMLEAAVTNDADAQAKKLLEAKRAYSDVIRTSTTTTDKALLSLTYVALARLYEFDENKDYAVKLYDKAIELSDVPGGAFQQAIEGKQRLLKNP